MMPFRPLTLHDGYLPIEDHGLIGDGATAALVGRDGRISWMCVPRFDSPPLFCGLLDAKDGGALTIAPADLLASHQAYLPDSGVLVTEMQSATGVVRVTDALTLRSGADLSEDAPAGRRELLRSVRVLSGEVTLLVEIEPRGGAEMERHHGGYQLLCASQPERDLHIQTTAPLDGQRSLIRLAAGETFDLIMRWQHRTHRHRPLDSETLLRGTVDAWHRWLADYHYDGPQSDLVRRSAITLKLLNHFANGPMIAAPTSSLPEVIGGTRNWDYRYAWIRDASFAVYALRRVGLDQEAFGFIGWALDASEIDGRLRVLYNLDGQRPPAEREDPTVEGYRGSKPVRWGNGAAEQVQHDVYGEVLDCAYLWAMRGDIDDRLWQELHALVETARQRWQQPDQGIWEVRTEGRIFTYSAAMCQVALNRGVKLATRFQLPADTSAWTAEADRIVSAILEESWDPRLNALTEHLGGGGLDASLLALPLRRVIPADHPRMIATTRAIAERLSAGNDLLYRYLPEVSPDGLPGQEGAFLLCSFWLVDNLALQRRLDEATALFDKLCARASPLGLLPEQVDPASGVFLGNFPQAFSHIGLISSGANIALATRQTT